MSEAKFEKYKVTTAAECFELEAASFEDVKRHVNETCPGQHAWVENMTRSTRPVMVVAVKLGPATPPLR
jgi:hypothetical protein